MGNPCDCKIVTKVLQDIRKSLREEEAAIDAYIERAHRADEIGGIPGLATTYQHIIPEEQQHFKELIDLEYKLAEHGTNCGCPLGQGHVPGEGAVMEKKVDRYRTAKCPKCGRFMKKREGLGRRNFTWICQKESCRA
jgi:hypothetical protein